MNADAIRTAINASNLAYLHNQQGTPHVLKTDTRVQTHGSELKGEFIGCLVGERVLPAGTEGLLFRSGERTYSETRWVGDETYPVNGADIHETGAHYSFLTLVEIAGHQVLADAYTHVVYDPPRLVGKVGE